MNKSILSIPAFMLCVASATVGAADFDGSRPLICATVEATECLADLDCESGTPNEMGAPGFMRLDFAGKTVSGPKRTTKILDLEKSPGQITLRGSELGYAWTMVIDAEGAMTATMAGRSTAFVLFGSCTTL